MGAETKIEWCHHTFNGWIGCTEAGPECDNCYAREQNNHWKWNGGKWGKGALRKVTSPSKWREPLKWNRDAETAGERRRVFAFSLADVADAEAPAHAYPWLWALVEATPWLDWMFLTKRPHRIRLIVPPAWLEKPPHNVWWGASVGTQKSADAMIPALIGMPAAIHFLSMEPLLEAVDLSKWIPVDSPIALVIVGGESGHGARSMRLEWARAIVEQCKAAGVACFFKQAGAQPFDGEGLVKLRDRKGGDLSELSGDWPREFPDAA